MSKVAICYCDSYDKADEAVSAVLELLGAKKLFSPDEKVLLKPNLLAKTDADSACTTHPAVFSAVAKYLLQNGITNLSYGDSPGHGQPEKVAAACGIADAASALSVPFADFSDGVAVPFEKGRLAKEFILARSVTSFDAIVNVCKMKTHMLERITGAQKNIFGCVFGLNKGACHVKYPNAEIFAEFLADLNLFLKPRIHIMDGISAMEGNGPQSGTPKKMNLILASLDPVALDSVFASLVHLDPYFVPTNRIGELRGVGVADPAKIEVVTEYGKMTVAEAVDKYGSKDFDVYRDAPDTGEISFLRPFKKLLTERPKIDKSKCVKCGICVKSCPVEGGALNFKKKNAPPVYDYKKCIGCYCCQEMCPKKAISKYRHPIAKIANIKFKF